jgi:tetratricopeptide (TPR) repeat protein
MHRYLWKRIASISALASVAVLLPGIARAAEWMEASSDHFVIYAQESGGEIKRLADKLERYHAAMALALRVTTPVPSPSNRVTIFVVRNGQEVRTLYRGERDANSSNYVTGFYLANAGGSVAIVPDIQNSSDETDASMVSLLHEYAHHFLASANLPPRPRWFTEGVAEFYAASRIDQDGSVALGRPAWLRFNELFGQKHLTAVELFDPAEYEKHKTYGYDAFYGKSWLLYHYLTFEPSRKGQLDKYVALLDAGKDQRDAAQEAFGSFDTLEYNLDRYMLARTMTSLTIPAALLHVGAVKVRPLPPGENAIMPALIRTKRGVGSPEAANAVLALARPIAAQYPHDTLVLSELAEAEFDAGHDKEAIDAADAALAIDPATVNAYIQKGYALFREAKGADNRQAAYDKAVAPFLKLNHVENDNPIPLIYFYRSFAEQGKRPTDLALSGLIRAMELAPFDMDLRMMLGQAFLARGQTRDARVVLLPVANNPHENAGSKAARAIVTQIDKDPNWKGDGVEAVLAGAS